MTDHGLAHVYMRLSMAPDLDALRRVWEGLGVEYQNHPDVISHKDRTKEALSK